MTVKVGGVIEDTIRNFENISGGSAGDMLTGDGLANVAVGNDGADTLRGVSAKTCWTAAMASTPRTTWRKPMRFRSR